MYWLADLEESSESRLVLEYLSVLARELRSESVCQSGLEYWWESKLASLHRSGLEWEWSHKYNLYNI